MRDSSTGRLRIAGLALALGTLAAGGCKKSASPNSSTATASPPSAAPSAAPAAPTSAPARLDPGARLAAAQDELIAAQDALTRRYLELDKRRVRLAKSTPAEVDAYNRDAAAYAADVEALRRRAETLRQLQAGAAAPKTALSPAPAAAPNEAQAQACLGRLRAAININDWSAQVAAMEQALAQYRQTAAFAQISEITLPRLNAATLAEVEKSLRARPPGTAPSANEGPSNPDTLLRELRAIINQPVAPMAKVADKSRVVNFHPGGVPLDYGKVTREDLMRERVLFPVPQVEPQSHRGVYYRGDDIEFNLLLKFYYADPTLPTKRLSDPEYDRIIAIARQIAQTPPAAPAPAVAAPAPAAQAAAPLWARIQKLKQSWPH